MTSYTHSSQGPPGQSKLFLNPAALSPAGDRANHTTFWRNPKVGNIYRNTEYITAPITQPLLDYCGLTEDKIASLDEPIEVLDMCCGAGVVSARIQEMLKATGQSSKGLVRLTCSDSSGGQIEHVRGRIGKDGWTDTTVVQADIAVRNRYPPKMRSSESTCIWLTGATLDYLLTTSESAIRVEQL